MEYRIDPGVTPGESEFSHEGLYPPRVWTDWDEQAARYTRVAEAPDRTPPELGRRYRGTTPPIHPNVRGRPGRS